MQKEYKSQRRWKTSRKQSPLNQHEQNIRELTETEAACTGPAQVHASMKLPDEYTCHPSTRRPLFTTNGDHYRKAQLDPMQQSVDH
ncbi:hypothetical protein LEMLEM_LOCUS1736, partial [Lemmus lemmus]